MKAKTKTIKRFNKYCVTFGNGGGSLDSLFFSNLKDSKLCLTQIKKDFKVAYIEKINATGNYKKI